MSDSYERSYYEIALTNRQVLTALAILLICIVGSFVAGLWVARDVLGQAASENVEVAEGDDQSEGVFEFFTGDDAADDGGTGAGDGDTAPVPTHLRPVAEPEPQQASPAASAQAGGPTERSEQKRQTEQSTPVESPPKAPAAEAEREEPVSLRQPTRRQAETPAPDPSDAAPGSPATSDGDLVIQVFSSADQNQANLLITRLRDGGYPAQLSPVDVEGRTMYRVRVGPYSDRGEAETIASAIKSKFRLDTWITRR